MEDFVQSIDMQIEDEKKGASEYEALIGKVDSVDSLDDDSKLLIKSILTKIKQDEEGHKELLDGIKRLL